MSWGEFLQEAWLSDRWLLVSMVFLWLLLVGWALYAADQAERRP